MFISLTSKNAIRILSFLAESNGKLSTDYISRSLGITIKNVRKILFYLSKHNFVNSVQGKNGGYYLAVAPENIYLKDIIEAIDGLEKYNQCIFGYENCSEDHPCPLHYQWQPIKEKFLDFISRINLKNIIENEELLNSNINYGDI